MLGVKGLAHGLDAINWAAPWVAPLRVTGEDAAERVVKGATVCDALTAAHTPLRAPVQFVPQAGLPDGTAYEQYIFDTGRVPTRDNLHDFFNGLCWLHFPQTKKRLNQLQAAQIEASGIREVRGAVRDALTVFDENAAFLQAPDPLWDALVTKDWHRLFVTLRPMWVEARLVLFGHALLEKLVSPRKPMTAHVYRVHVASDSIAVLDTWAAADLNVDKLARKPFAHLPVLGVPGWWPANGDPGFYDDSSVFRAPKNR